MEKIWKRARYGMIQKYTKVTTISGKMLTKFIRRSTKSRRGCLITFRSKKYAELNLSTSLFWYPVSGTRYQANVNTVAFTLA